MCASGGGWGMPRVGARSSSAPLHIMHAVTRETRGGVAPRQHITTHLKSARTLWRIVKKRRAVWSERNDGRLLHLRCGRSSHTEPAEKSTPRTPERIALLPQLFQMWGAPLPKQHSRGLDARWRHRGFLWRARAVKRLEPVLVG